MLIFTITKEWLKLTLDKFNQLSKISLELLSLDQEKMEFSMVLVKPI
jgi:hypothetical protein